MKREKLFLSTSKEDRKDGKCMSAELMYRSGMVHNYGSGVFSYSTFGKKLLDNISDIIREEIERIRSQEVLLNLLQDSQMWKNSGRWENFESKELFKLKNRDGKEFCLAATHEEAVVEMAKKVINSYRDLEFSVFQIGRKFRDDHARKGLLRAKEFHMKDAYSFHRNQENMDRKFREFEEAYRKIFRRLGLEFSVISADNGSMGGSSSKEFITESEEGSDTYMKCSNKNCRFGTKNLERGKCGRCGSDLRETRGIELGHIFKLGDRYSRAMDLVFDDEKGEKQFVEMGCYGIGVSRVVSALLETNSDKDSINLNSELSVFDTTIITVGDDDRIKEKAEELHDKLRNSFEIILYGENFSVGEAFNESDLLGVKNRIVLGRNFLENGKIEIETNKGDKHFLEEKEVADFLL